MPSWKGERGTRQQRGYDARWDKLRLTILRRDNFLCQPCLRADRVTALMVRPLDHAVDHIKPKSQGGTDHPSNLEATCAECHAIKTGREAAEAQGRKVALGFTEDGRAVWPD